MPALSSQMSLLQHSRAAFRLFFAFLWMLIFFLTLLMVSWSKGWLYHVVRQWLYRIPIMVMGIRLHVKGKATKEKPAIFVSNHSSYVDILSLGAVLPGSFISKEDVRGWPLVGTIAWLTRTVFINRSSTRAFEELSKIKERVYDEERLILFPEGTTSDGSHILPFKSSSFKVVEEMVDGRRIFLQPVSVIYSAVNGKHMDEHSRTLVAWYDDMYLLPHVWRLFGFRHVDITIILGKAMRIDSPVPRKVVAKACHKQVSDIFYDYIGKDMEIYDDDVTDFVNSLETA